MTKAADSHVPAGRDRPETRLDEGALGEAFERAYLSAVWGADHHFTREQYAFGVAAYAREISSGSLGAQIAIQEPAGILAYMKNRLPALSAE